MREQEHLNVFFYVYIQNFVLFSKVMLEPQKIVDFQVSPIAQISNVCCFIACKQIGNVG